jgi:hypothetical protein
MTVLTGADRVRVLLELLGRRVSVEVGVGEVMEVAAE